MEGEDHIHKEDNTPEHVDKKQKKDKEIASETEKHEEEEKGLRMKIKVEHIRDRPDRIPPIVGYFSTGYDPFAVNPETGEKETPKVTVYRHKDESVKRGMVVVSPPNANVDFVGTNYTGENAAKKNVMYRLGILNKETKTMKVIPIAYNTIIRLEPVIRSRKAVDPETSGSGAGEEERVIKASETNLLFGTKEATTWDKKKDALNLGNDIETQKFLDEKLKQVHVNAGGLESTGSIVAHNIPPYNASATTPREAYPLEHIIEKGEWDFLKDIYRLVQLKTRTARNLNTYPVFVQNRLDKLRDIKNNIEKQTVSGVLSLLTHLVRFKDLNSGSDYIFAKRHKFPEIIYKKCMSLFKDPESKRISIDKTNLLISYVLVLALHVDKFRTDPLDIAKDLRMSRSDVIRHFKNLGCRFMLEESTFLATLPVPLRFPQIMQKRRKR